jgi:drug/metabolite transporter (DMT)-like permease
MSPTARAHLQIHFCVLLWGFTAILGKLITLPALPLVWWRMLIVVALLALLPYVWRRIRLLPARLIAAYAGIGVLVGLHWLTFYGAIKLANASVAATCIALAPVFLALVEPLLTGRRFNVRELLFGLAVLPGVALVVGGVDAEMRIGIAVGVLSALLVACFGALNKRLVEHGDPLAVTAIELGAGTLALTLLAPLIMWLMPGESAAPWTLPDLRDGVLILILAVVCTLLPFALALVALRHMSAFSAQLAVNLEPVYAIGLAIVLLGEQHELSLMFYAGVVIVLAAVVLHPVVNRVGGGMQQPELLGTAEGKGVVE